jgi:hypothetical protein
VAAIVAAILAVFHHEERTVLAWQTRVSYQAQQLHARLV